MHEQTTEQLPPATVKPCNECPWVRTARPGHLGPLSAQEWVEMAHGESAIACHKTIIRTDEEGSGDWSDPAIRQCAGAAQFRTNVFKSPRDPAVATADQRDTETVFSWNADFIAHHTQ